MSLTSTKLSSGNGLRQKAINLFYLIFLILLFSFIPSDFVDSAYHTNSSLDLISNDINRLSKDNTLFFLHLLKKEPELFKESQEKFLEIERLTNNTTQYIDKLKLDLINVDKIDEFGFFRNGRKETTSNEMMIYGKRADSLFNKLEAYKKTISEYLTYDGVDHINTILPLSKYEKNADGNFINSGDYFFKRTPLNVSILNLSHFKSRIERIKVYVEEKLITYVVYNNPSIQPFKDIRIAKDETVKDIYTASTVEDFFEKINTFEFLQSEEKNKQEQKNKYYIESLTDTIHPLGKAIKYYVHFDDKADTKIRIKVKSDDGVKYFGVSKSGPFYFYPSSKGRYQISFSNSIKTTSKRITVIDADPIIQNSKLSTLYIGLDNPLNIKTSEFDENDELIAEITDGQVIKKGETFYARVFNKGITQVVVYANMPYGKIKVAEKSFIIRELHNPIPHINNLQSGGVAKQDRLIQFENMSLKTDEYLVEEDVYIADFEFMIIFENYNKVSKPISNVGSSFNNVIKKTIDNAKKGDILIFSNIRTLSSRGTETIIPSLTLTVI